MLYLEIRAYLARMGFEAPEQLNKARNKISCAVRDLTRADQCRSRSARYDFIGSAETIFRVFVSSTSLKGSSRNLTVAILWLDARTATGRVICYPEISSVADMAYKVDAHPIS